MANILDGRQLASDIKLQIKDEVQALKERYGKVPRMVNIIIGNDPGSCSYAKSQMRAAEQVGMRYDLATVEQNISQEGMIEYVRNLNEDPDVNGIMIHKPIPEHIDYREVANHVDVNKDLEGINVANIGKMVLNETQIIPCTPASVMAHLKASGVNLRGKEAVIVGASEIVGRPLSLLLLNEMATVTICHIATSKAGKLVEHVQRADVLVVAVGKAGLIKGEMVKEGAVVVDVGINRQGNSIVGDVDFDSAKERAGHITPVPGGVGPVTVAMLMRNALEAFKIQSKDRS